MVGVKEQSVEFSFGVDGRGCNPPEFCETSGLITGRLSFSSADDGACDGVVGIGISITALGLTRGSSILGVDSKNDKSVAAHGSGVGSTLTGVAAVGVGMFVVFPKDTDLDCEAGGCEV